MDREELARGWAFAAACSVKGARWARLHGEAVRIAGAGLRCDAEAMAELEREEHWPLASRLLVMRSPWLADSVAVPYEPHLDSDRGRHYVRRLYEFATGTRPRHASWLHAVEWLEGQR